MGRKCPVRPAGAQLRGQSQPGGSSASYHSSPPFPLVVSVPRALKHRDNGAGRRWRGSGHAGKAAAARLLWLLLNMALGREEYLVFLPLTPSVSITVVAGFYTGEDGQC